MAEGVAPDGPGAPGPPESAARDLAFLADAFGAHGDLVHDQVGWRLRAAGSAPHPNEVADIVRDSFMVAHAAPARPPAALLRPWLLAVARNECLRALERPGRAPWPTVAPPPADLSHGEPVIDDPQVPHPGGGLPRKDLRTLVRWAAEGLDRREREILELGMRHGLPAEEISRVMGVGRAVAGWALEDLSRQFTRVLGTLLLTRSAVGSCVRLADLARRWDGTPRDDLRRRVLRHADACETCSAERVERVDAAGVVRIPPLDRAPRAVKHWVLADATDGRLAAERAVLADRAGPFTEDGFPLALDAELAVRRSSTLARPARESTLRPAVRSR